jgi:O-antigen/teichoic acid export membrane protein
MMRSLIRDIQETLGLRLWLLIASLIVASLLDFYDYVGNVTVLSFLGSVIAFVVITEAIQVTRRGSEMAWRSWSVVTLAFTGGLILAAAFTEVSPTAIIGIAFGGAVVITAIAGVADALYLRDKHKRRASPS